MLGLRVIRPHSRFAVRMYSSDPSEILKKGFRKVQETGEKSEESLREMVTAAGRLGIAEEKVRSAYSLTERSVPYAELPLETKRQLYQQDVKVHNAPSVEHAHVPFQYDDISSMGHLQLRDQRNQRHYNRIAAYELPLLSRFAEKYVPPSASKDILKFRYTTYLGEQHSGERKVSVEFKVASLPGLNEKQLHKVKLLLGSRYNPETDVAKLSSSSYTQAVQNKRALGDTINRLLKEAKSGDMFEDIPLDPRHSSARKARVKTNYLSLKFPEEWKRPDLAPKGQVVDLL